MQKDFHYFAIRVLAEKAGFKPADAQIIAYASQYVDDATEHKPIDLPVKVEMEFPRLKDKLFDPTCTAHKGIQFLQDFKKQTQMQIYMCFHFLPEKIYEHQKNFSYIVKADSEFANLLLNKAKENFKNHPNEKLYNLIALGIALHTYADTWSHQGFSGRHNYFENHVSKLRFWQDGKWWLQSKIGKVRKKLLPVIGHAEAYNFPDLPFLLWEYKKNRKIRIRNNLDFYIHASKKIFDFLCSFNEKHSKWQDFGPSLIQCLSNVEYNLNRRCDFYKEIFPEIGFYYNRNLWKNYVLYPNRFKNNLTLYTKKTSIPQNWLIFHKAAFEQRRFVLKNIKPL